MTTLYKFYPAHWGREALYRQRFKVTTQADINDPFEFLATSKNPEARQKAREIRDEEFQEFGLISFSKSWTEPLMWSHYADHHKGLVIGFQLRNSRHGFDVNYAKERVQMPDTEKYVFGQQTNLWKNIRITKSVQWSYEQEVRVFPPLEGPDTVRENGKYFFPFAALGAVSKVILGPNYEPINDENLQVTLEQNGIGVITSRLSFQKFEVCRQNDAEMVKHL